MARRLLYTTDPDTDWATKLGADILQSVLDALHQSNGADLIAVNRHIAATLRSAFAERAGALRHVNETIDEKAVI